MEEDEHARGTASGSSVQIRENFGGLEAGGEGKTRHPKGILGKNCYHVDGEQWAARQKLSHKAGSRPPFGRKNHIQSSTKGEASGTMLPAFSVRVENSLLSPLQISEPLHECKKPSCASKIETPHVEKIQKIEKSSKTSTYLIEQLRDRRLQLSQGRREDIVSPVSDSGIVGPSFIVPNNINEVNVKIESEGVQRKGLKTTGLSRRRESIIPSGEKLENPPATNPPKSMKLCPKKNQRKSGCSTLKNLSVCNTDNLLGTAFIDGSEEDCRMLLDAAKYAPCASVLACSGSFWKITEPIFASVGVHDTSDLDKKDNLVCRQESLSNVVNSEEVKVNQLDELGSYELDNTVYSVDQSQDMRTSCGGFKSERALKNVFPLSQRILSAIIEVEDVDGVNLDEKRSRTSQSPVADDPFRKYVEQHNEDAIDSEVSKRIPDALNPLYNDYITQGNDDMLPSKAEVTCGSSKNRYHTSSGDTQYQSMSIDERCMLELQSIGLCHEMASGEVAEEANEIDYEINELRMKLQQQALQAHETKENVRKAIKAEKRRDVEQIAVDKLVELAYQTSKTGASKKSKKPLRQKATEFAKLTIKRCREYEDTGKSCFREPSLYNIITSAPESNILASFARKSGAKGRDGKRTKRVFPNKTEQQGRPPSGPDCAESCPKPKRTRKRRARDIVTNVSLEAKSGTGDSHSNTATGTGSRRDKGQQKDIAVPTGDPKDNPKANTETMQNTAQESTLGIDVQDKVTDVTVPVSSLEMSTEVVTYKCRNVNEAELPSCSNVAQGLSESFDVFPGWEDFELPDINTLGLGLSEFDEIMSDDSDFKGLAVPMDNLSDLNLPFFY